jgi:mRNA interferase RelE/StbE
MAYNVRVDNKAAKQLEKLDKINSDRILKFLKQLAQLDNPRSKGEALIEQKFKGLWRYRIGDYRLLCYIKDDELIILLVDIGHRSKVYR